MWKDVGASSISDMDVTDLISVEPWFKGKPVPYACKVNKRLTPEAEKFFLETIREGLSAGKYMHIYSEWNAPAVIAYKPAIAHLGKNEIQRLRDEPFSRFPLDAQLPFPEQASFTSANTS